MGPFPDVSGGPGFGVELREVHGEMDSTAAERYDFSGLCPAFKDISPARRSRRWAALWRPSQAEVGLTREAGRYCGTLRASRSRRFANLKEIDGFQSRITVGWVVYLTRLYYMPHRMPAAHGVGVGGWDAFGKVKVTGHVRNDNFRMTSTVRTTALMSSE